MTVAYIGLGSNLGDSLQVLQDGWKMLGRSPGITLEHFSSPYRTEPVGMVSSNWFVNAVGSLHTTLGPHELLGTLLQVEERFGRKRDRSKQGYRDRILDLDLLMYGSRILSEQGLELPHPQMQDRLFVLQPMSEIAPEACHPVLKETVRQLLKSLVSGSGASAVEKISWPQSED